MGLGVSSVRLIWYDVVCGDMGKHTLEELFGTFL